MKLNTKLLTISALFIAALMLLSPISQINTSGGGGTNNYDLDFLNSLDINNNNFVLSADSLSDSVDINYVEVVDKSGTKELQCNGEKVDSKTTFISVNDVDGLKQLSNLVNDATTPFDFSGYTIKLTKNLILDDPDPNQSNFTPIGKDSTHTFNGTFDGQGHTISNLSVNIDSNSGKVYAGLFGRLDSGAIVKNLGIINSEISATVENGSAASGGIAGSNSGTITNCYNTGTVNSKLDSGGIAGGNDGTITNCYNIGTVNGTETSGGIAGGNTGTITNCYNTVDLNGSTYSGGIAGRNYGPIENCYNTGTVTGSTYSGGIAGLNISTIQYCYHQGGSDTVGSNAGTTPNCKSFDEYGILSGGNKSLLDALNEWVTNPTVGKSDDYRYWMEPFIQDEKYPVFTDWYGEAERLNKEYPNDSKYKLPDLNDKGVYEIENGYQLALIADKPKGSYVLSYDIDLSGYEWRPIGKDESHKFKGTFDGNGYTISKLSININSKSGNVYAGLFGYLDSSATVKNLGIINSEISATVVSGNAVSGGIAAYNDGTITNCYNTGDVTASSNSGGIAGFNGGTITNCYNTGTVNSSYSSGGIAGYNRTGTITNCYNTGAVTGSYSGGIAGYQGTLTTDEGTITNCYNTGNVTGSSSGGIAGYNTSGTITNCYNTGNVTGSSSGGIAGYNTSGTITNCYNTGNVTATSTNHAYSGGIAGDNGSGNGKITNCYNTGNVTGTTYSGGITGYYGGLGTAITNCYNIGDVTGTTYSGGIAAYNEGTIENCYNTGDVTGSGTSGGIAGYCVAIKNCYYLGIDDSIEGTTNLSEDEMKKLKLLGGDGSKYDLNKEQDSKPWSPDIFGVNDGYPILADVPTQIDPNSINKNPQSAVYVTLGSEDNQAENYLKQFILTNGNEVSATINCLNNQDKNITSYQWYTMNNDGDFIEVSETSLPEIVQETYYVKVTINGYSYTSLTRTVSDTFIVMFDSNDGSDVKSIIVSNGKTIAEPENQTKTGYTFEGWYTSDDKKWDFSSDKVTKNMTLYAVWTPIPEPIYTLCLNSNDSTLQTKRYSGTYGTEVTLKSASDFGWNESCKFIEWNSKSDGSGISYKEGDKFSLGSEVWNLYAIWSDSSYHTVSFDSNGGSNVPSQSVQDGYRASEPTDPEKQGHSFKHWSLNGTKYDFNQSVKEDMTLKAEYEIISYKVTFYYNGDVYYSTVADYNTSLGDRMPSLPSDKDSWNTSENGKGSNFNADSLITSDISIYAVSESSITSILIIGGSAAAILAAIAAWLFMRSRYN